MLTQFFYRSFRIGPTVIPNSKSILKHKLKKNELIELHSCQQMTPQLNHYYKYHSVTIRLPIISKYQVYVKLSR